MKNSKTPLLIDTHAHLNDKRFDGEMSGVLARAKEKSIAITIVPGADLRSSQTAVELAAKYPQIYSAVGIHPHDAEPGISDRSAIVRLAQNAIKSGDAIAIGETGLDYHYDHSPRDSQIDNLRFHLELAQDLNMPIILHNRESDEDMMRTVDEVGLPERGAVMHCFSGDEELAAWALDWGMLLSFTGVVTFRKTPNTEGVFALLDPGKVMVETDAPYMAPHPYRGKRCEPAYVTYIAKRLAENLEVDYDELTLQTTLNAREFFDIPIDFGGDIVYQLGNSLYINLTNRCDNDCAFCVRNNCAGIAGYNLWLNAEPLTREITTAIVEPTRYNEIVFCGFGEPTQRWETTVEVARWVKKYGGKTRLNTNGLGIISNGYNIIDDMPGLFDSVNVSLNATDAASYNRICHSRYGGKAFGAVVDFIKRCKKRNILTRISMVSESGVNRAEFEALAIKLGVEAKVR